MILPDTNPFAAKRWQLPLLSQDAYKLIEKEEPEKKDPEPEKEDEQKEPETEEKEKEKETDGN